MPTMIERLGIDRMTVAEKRELVERILESIPEEATPEMPADPATNRITPEEAAEWLKNFQPRDDWERRILAMGRDCGVSLSDEALSREEIYD